MITNVAIVPEKPTAKAITKRAIARATKRYPIRLASSVHFAIRARFARMGSGFSPAVEDPALSSWAVTAA